MTEWVDVCDLSALSADEPKVCVQAAERSLVAVLVGDEVRVIDNMCPHAGMPLGDGDVNGAVITCPYHGYAYDVRTGRNVDYPDDIPVSTYEVRIEGETVQAKVQPGGSTSP